jgi:hypothetical protein
MIALRDLAIKLLGIARRFVFIEKTQKLPTVLTLTLRLFNEG